VIARAFLAALLAVLTLAWASSAWAECAWVLWWNVDVADGGDKPAQPSVKGAYERKQECERVMQTELTQDEHNRWKNDDPQNPGYRTTRGDNYLFTTKGRWWIRVDYLCLPDGVDPRGPKASGR